MVPASTKIKYKRVGNVDTERLMRRRAYMREHMGEWARAADARIEVRMIAREFMAIEHEMTRRGVEF